MGGYLVRLKSNREIVGAVFAPNVHAAADIVEECVQADLCEYRRLPARGGFLWGCGVQARLPMDPEAGHGELDGAVASEDWFDAFYGEGEWLTLPPSAIGRLCGSE